MSATTLSGGLVVTSLSPPQVLERDLAIEDGRVTEASRGSGERVDATGTLIVPGNVCAHHHLYSALARGMPYGLGPPSNFLQVLQRIWWRLDRALDDALVSASASAGAADALLAGTTTIVDHHASPNAIEGSLSRIADALEQLGARAILAYEVTDRDGPERAAAGLEEHRRFAAEPRERTAMMLGAHASFTLSPETLEACLRTARSLDVGIHVHVAEDAADEADSERRFGVRVAQRLADAGGLTDRDLLAHCIHLDAAEHRVVREAGAWAVHNPRSNMNNRVGHLPPSALERVALGTDGIGGDMFAEAQTSFWRAREADPDVDPAWAIERLASSARFAGAAFGEPGLGTLELGAPADLVVLEYRPPTPLTDDNLAAHWVYGLSSRMVRDVYIAGEPVVLDRRLTRVDGPELANRTAREAARLWARMDGIDVHPFDPATSWG